MSRDAGLLTRASGELVERLRVGYSKQQAASRKLEQKQASKQASQRQPVAIDKADDTTMR